MQYRAEVDGLRALAVIPVILFHAGYSWISGGFVGVDVFFVISGYLITSIILHELHNGGFSLIHFWERRARRIIPALFFVLGCSVPAAWWLLSPQDLVSYGESLSAVPLFMSNILFWFNSGYFDTVSEYKPLLHTWSLAVEEQFYLGFPLLMVLLWHIGKRQLPLILVVLLLLSLGLSEWAASYRPSFAFYMLPTRAWELLAGGLVAWFFYRNPAWRASVRVAEAASVTGISLILFAMFSFDSRTVFPGMAAVLPVAGTVLLLMFARVNTIVGQLLALRPFVLTGLLSYSAYLWHQPLFAFARHATAAPLSNSSICIIIILTFAMAYLSWRFVEQPFRKGVIVSRQRIFKLTLVGSGFLLSAGLLMATSHVSGRWQLQHPQLVNIDPPARPQAQICPEFRLYGTASCKLFGEGRRRLVVWGDSHAGVLASNYPGLANTQTMVIAHGGCPPVSGVRRFDGLGNASNCDQLSILSSYLAAIEAYKPDLIVLSARWTLYLKGWIRQGQLQSAHHYLTTANSGGESGSESARAEILLQQLRQTILRLSQTAPVLLLTQQPDYAETGFRPLERSDFLQPVAAMQQWHLTEMQVFARLAATENLQILDSKTLFCNKVVCKTRENGVLLYFDTNHLTATGAAKVWAAIRQSDSYRTAICGEKE